MARPRVKDICNILLKPGVAGHLLGLYMILAQGACASQREPKAQPAVSRVTLTVQMRDGSAHEYELSPAIGAVSVPPAAPPEGWLRPFFRNFAVGVTVPLVLLGVGELFSYLKRRRNSQALKEKARHRTAERRRLLRAIYAAEEELDALEDEMKKKKDDAAIPEEQHNEMRARRQELLFMIDDLRYQLYDIYHNSSSKVSNAEGVDDSDTATSSYYGVPKTSGRRRRVASRPLLPDNYTAGNGDAVGRANLGGAALGKTSPTSRRGDPSNSAHLQEERHAKYGNDLGYDRKHLRRQHPLGRRGGQRRVEVIRQLLDEVPGLPPEEILRIAEKADKAEL